MQVIPDSSAKVILFTGSSSIRLWNDIQGYFPDRLIINTGFGGSHMSDLQFFLDELVLRYKPDQVFIYEGDNDMASGKRPGKVLRQTKKIVEEIMTELPGVQVAFISPKPSLARWEIKKRYEKLNKLLRNYAMDTDQVAFIDVWSLMLDEAGEPIKEIFLEDGLHMNRSGYNRWATEIRKFFYGDDNH
jgi:lysophospholipase L1-like esterase